MFRTCRKEFSKEKTYICPDTQRPCLNVALGDCAVRLLCHRLVRQEEWSGAPPPPHYTMPILSRKPSLYSSLLRIFYLLVYIQSTSYRSVLCDSEQKGQVRSWPWAKRRSGKETTESAAILIDTAIVYNITGCVTAFPLKLVYLRITSNFRGIKLLE